VCVFDVCVCVCVCVCVFSPVILHLILDVVSHQLDWADWPAISRDPPVSAPSALGI